MGIDRQKLDELLGKYLLSLSSIESIVDESFVILFSEKDNQLLYFRINVLLSELDFRKKVSILKGFYELEPSVYDSNKVKSVFKKIHSSYNRRNEYLHHQWFSDQHGNVTLQKSENPLKDSKSLAQKINLADIQKDIESNHILYSEISKLMFSHIKKKSSPKAAK